MMTRKHRHLYFTHALNTLYGQLETVVKTIGADRVLFGSQMPYWDPSPCLKSRGRRGGLLRSLGAK